MVDDCLDAERPVNHPFAVENLTAKGADAMDVGERAGRILWHKGLASSEPPARSPGSRHLFDRQAKVGEPAADINRIFDDGSTERRHVYLVFKNHALIREEDS